MLKQACKQQGRPVSNSHEQPCRYNSSLLNNIVETMLNIYWPNHVAHA